MDNKDYNSKSEKSQPTIMLDIEESERKLNEVQNKEKNQKTSIKRKHNERMF